MKWNKRLAEGRRNHACYMRESGETFKYIGDRLGVGANQAQKIFLKGKWLIKANYLLLESTPFDEPSCRKKSGEDMTALEFCLSLRS